VAEAQSLPDVLQVHARTSSGTIMGIQHKNHLTFGVQFHPESILTPDGPLLLKRFFKFAGIEPCAQAAEAKPC
jgi:anthranilate synthase/phosphoribosyltransferase